MQVSDARAAANRRNAAKSTGPRTMEGKAICRANALKHGLCAAVVVPEDHEQIQSRAEMLYQAFKPYTDYQAWQVDRAAVLTFQIERCERMERRVRDKDSLRAALTWEDDRRLEAEVLGGMLAKRPTETVEALRRTPQGCEWLMTRWAMLAHAADSQPAHAWTVEQTALAFDLSGTPVLFRVGQKPGAALDFDGNVLESADDSAAVARRMVAELKERREAVLGLDEVNRALVEADLAHDTSDELRRLRRYEATLQNRLRWTIKQLQFQGPSGKPDPGYFPKFLVDAPPLENPEAKTADEKAAEAHDFAKVSPPFDLTPDEYPAIGEMPDIPKILASRKHKKQAKSDARREALRRAAKELTA